MVALVNGRFISIQQAHGAHNRLGVSTAVAIDCWLGKGSNGRSVCDRLQLMPVTAVGSCGVAAGRRYGLH